MLNVGEVMDLVFGHVYYQLNGQGIAVPYLQGPPGIGKTQITLSETNRRNMNMFHIHFAVVPIEEVSGIPVISRITLRDNETEYQGTDWTVPEILTKAYEFQGDKPLVILIDDVHVASPGHNALMLEMFTQKTLRGKPFPQNSAFILAGNHSSKAGARPMFSAVHNRIAIYKLDNNYELLFDYWKSNYAMKTNINKKIISFLSNEQYGNKHFVGEEINGQFPSPRQWSNLSVILNGLEEAKRNNPRFITEISAAHVGEEAAADFSSFYNFYSNTDIDSVFDKKARINIPEDNMGRYIYGISAVYEFASRTKKNKNDKKESESDVNIFSDIVIAIANVASEIALVMLKEIIMYEASLESKQTTKSLFSIIKNRIREINPDVEKRLTRDIINSSASIDV